MWKMTTPAIPILRPMLPSTGHHLDHRNPHMSPLHEQDRNPNLPEEALPTWMRKTEMRRTSGMVSTWMPKNTLSVHKDLVYPVERVLLESIGNSQRTDNQDERVVVTVTSDLSRQRAGGHPLMLTSHARLPCLHTTLRQMVSLP
jgi:hypothetical protein